MVRFQAQQPGLRLIQQPVDADDKRETPFKQLVGLYGMWASLAPETRNAIANIFGGEDEVLDTAADVNRDPVLDEVVNPDAGNLMVMPDGSISQIGELEYSDLEEPEKWQPKHVIDIEVGPTDPWGIGQISTEPAKSKARRDIYPDSLSMKDTVGPSYYDGATPNALSTRQSKKLTAGGNQSVLDSWPPNNNKTSRTGLFDPTGYWSILL